MQIIDKGRHDRHRKPVDVGRMKDVSRKFSKDLMTTQQRIIDKTDGFNKREGRAYIKRS